jgi:hypothetical protein
MASGSKSLSFELVEIENPKELNFILGHGKSGRRGEPGPAPVVEGLQIVIKTLLDMITTISMQFVPWGTATVLLPLCWLLNPLLHPSSCVHSSLVETTESLFKPPRLLQ